MIKTIKSKAIPIHKNGIVDTLELLLNEAKNGQLAGIVIAGFLKGSEKDIFVVHENITSTEQQTLVSYLQSETVMRLIGMEEI